MAVLLKYLLIVFLCVIPVAADAAGLIKPTNTIGLIGYWKLDDGSGTSVTDSSGNSRTLTFQDSPTWVEGTKNGALSFDGSNDYVSGSSLPTSAEGEFTLSLWLYPLSGGGSPQRPISLGDNGPQLWFLSTGAIAVVHNGTYDTTSGGKAGGVTNDTWTLWTITLQGTSLKLYKNGVLFDENTNFTYDYAFDETFLGKGQGFDENYKGYMDDVRFYNRALSAAEVLALYTGNTTKIKLGQTKVNASSVTLQQGSTLARNLAGHWTFDGADFTDKVYDKSGNSNNGYVFNAATSSVKMAGKMGQALHLDGVDDSVRIADAATLDPGTSDFAISLWARGYNMESGDALVLKTNGGGESTTYGFHYGVFGTRQPTMHISTGAAFTQIQSATSLEEDVWNHIVITIDRDTMANTKIYINGVETNTNVTNPTSNTGSISNSVPLSIGSESDGEYWWDGEIDDVRYYMRTLSANEIKQLYLMGK